MWTLVSPIPGALSCHGAAVCCAACAAGAKESQPSCSESEARSLTPVAICKRAVSLKLAGAFTTGCMRVRVAPRPGGMQVLCCLEPRCRLHLMHFTAHRSGHNAQRYVGWSALHRILGLAAWCLMAYNPRLCSLVPDDRQSHAPATTGLPGRGHPDLPATTDLAPDLWAGGCQPAQASTGAAAAAAEAQRRSFAIRLSSMQVRGCVSPENGAMSARGWDMCNSWRARRAQRAQRAQALLGRERNK